MKRIGDILTRNKTPVVVDDSTSYKQVTIRTNYKGVVLRGSQDGSTIGTKNQFAVSAGQFILSRIDARNGAFGIIPEELEGAIVTNDFLAYDINEDEVERDYFNVFLQSPVFLEACIKASRGNTNRKRVEEGFFLNYEVNLPPLPEQHQLIKQINKGRARIGAAQSGIARQESLLVKLKQAILHEAIQGKLTTDWRAAHPDVESASQLLSRIQAEKARLIATQKLRPGKSLPKITDNEIPFEIPKSWIWARLADVGYVGTGATPATDNKAYYENGKIPWITSSATGMPFVSKADTMITELALAKTNCSIYPKHTLLVAMYGQGKTRGQVTELLIDAATNQACAAIVVPEGFKETNQFTKLVIQENYHRIRELAQGGSQPNINLLKVKSSLVPLPPLPEQAAIVERVEALMTTCRALEAEIEHSRSHAAHLLQAVLKEAFAPVQ